MLLEIIPENVYGTPNAAQIRYSLMKYLRCSQNLGGP
jgi:hypothetical protein